MTTPKDDDRLSLESMASIDLVIDTVLADMVTNAGRLNLLDEQFGEYPTGVPSAQRSLSCVIHELQEIKRRMETARELRRAEG